MAQFINIEGTLINLDNVVQISQLDEHLIFTFNTPDGDAQSEWLFLASSPAAIAAYEWLKRTCVAAFTDAEHGADEVQICNVCGNKYENRKALDYHLSHYHRDAPEGEGES